MHPATEHVTLRAEPGRALDARKRIVLISADRLAPARAATDSKGIDIRFQRAFDHGLAPMGVWGRDGQILEANDRLLALLGRTRADVAAGTLRWDTITPPEYIALDRRALEEIAAGGSCTPFEKEYLRPDGQRVPVLIGAAAFEDATSGLFFALDLTQQRAAEAAVKASEQRLRTALAATQGMVYEWDQERGVVERSDGLSAIVGWDASEVPPTRDWWSSITHPEDLERLQREGSGWTGAARDRVDMTYRVRHRDGHWVDVLDRAIVVDGPDGTRRMVGHTTDISDRRRAERRREVLGALDAALRVARTSEDVLRAALDGMPAAMEIDRLSYAHVDVDGDTYHVLRSAGPDRLEDGRAYRLSAFASDALIDEARSGHSIVVRDLANDPRTAGREGLGGLRGAFVLVPVIRAGRWVAALSASARTPREWLPSTVDLMEGVAARVAPALERARVEDELRVAGERLERALEAGAVATWSWDVASDVMRVDGRLAHLFGLLPSGRDGYPLQRILDAVADEDRARVTDLVDHALRTGEPYLAEYRVTDGRGGQRWVRSRGLVERHPDGTPVRFPGVLVDITEQVESEQRLLENETRLRAALAAKDEFLGLVSHELRTPMTVILGLSSILAQRHLDPDRVQELARDIQASAGALNGIVESMLLLARLDQDEAARLREPVMLGRAAEAVLEGLRPGGGHPLALTLKGEQALVEVEPTWLDRVIGNLVGNALKYSRPGSPVDVIVEGTHEEARLLVLDRGVGLAEVDLGRVFEPFYRAPDAGHHAEGSGLGLAVARRIVELLGGRIWAAPRDGGGAEFGFALPRISVDP